MIIARPHRRTLALFGVLSALCLLFGAAPASADQTLDCEALASSAGREPAGYSEQCLGRPHGTQKPPITILGGGGPGPAFTQNAFSFNLITGFSSEPGLFSFALEDFSERTLVTETVGPDASDLAWFGWSFDSSGALWAIHNTTRALGTVDTETGEFTLVSTIEVGEHHLLTGLTIDPVQDVFYLSVGQGSASVFYRLTPETGKLEQIGGEFQGLIVDLAMNCEGELYAHDIASDALYRVDIETAETTLIGAHGYDANFAQGMDFDNADGTLYGCIYTGGGSNIFGKWDTSTGEVTPINTDDPPGEWKCAIPNPCPIRSLELSAPVDISFGRAGDVLSYLYAVKNTGNVTLDDVTVSDPLSGNVTCSPSTLLPDESASCGPAEYTVTSSDIVAGEIVFTAKATANGRGGHPVEDEAATRFELVASPKLELIAPVGVTFGRAGELLSYHYTVKNTGNIALDDVEVSDPLSGNVTCSPSTLLPDESASCGPAEYTVTASGVHTGEIVFAAKATAMAPDGSVVEAQDAARFEWREPKPEGDDDAGVRDPSDDGEASDGGCGCSAGPSGGDPLASLLLIALALGALSLRQRVWRV